MPRSIESMKRLQMGTAPRKQLASKAARKSAPSSIPSASSTHSSIIDLTSSPPPQETLDFPGLKSMDRPVMRRVPLKQQLASKAARKSAPSVTYERYYETSEPSSPSEDMPTSHILTKEESAGINDSIRDAIASVSEKHLRSAILKVCGQSPETAELLVPLISDADLLVPAKKRKRSREICENCGEIASYEDDGCCKSRKMGGYR